MKMIFCCLLMAMLLPVGQSTTESTQPFRTVNIPAREYGYTHFESIALLSKSDLDSLLKKTSARPWNHRREFVDGLVNANVDFSKEALVLLRHTERSGSVNVEFKTPVLQGRNLVCEIAGKPIPDGFGGTGDMAEYCFAVVVSKAHVSQ